MFLLMQRSIMAKKQVGEERVYLASTPTSLFIIEGNQRRTQTGQESGGWSKMAFCVSKLHRFQFTLTNTFQVYKSATYRGHGGVLLTGFLLMTCLACFLIVPRTPSLGMALPTMNPWAFPHQLLIKKMSYRSTYNPIQWRHFLD